MEFQAKNSRSVITTSIKGILPPSSGNQVSQKCEIDTIYVSNNKGESCGSIFLQPVSLVKVKIIFQLKNRQKRRPSKIPATPEWSQIVNMYNKEEAEIVMKLVRQDFQDKGYFAHRLHGCAGCDDFIWIKHEDMICPNCNNLDGR